MNKSCLTECAVKEQNCRSQQDITYNMCNSNAIAAQHACQAIPECHFENGHRICHPPICLRASCYLDYSSCFTIFNLCYEA